MPDLPDVYHNIILYMMQPGMSNFPMQSGEMNSAKGVLGGVKRRKRKNNVAKRMYLGYNPTESIFGF